MDKKAYVNGGDVKHIDLPELTLVAQFNKTVSEFGNEKIYFYDSDGNASVYTYASIKSQALKILKGLHKCGIKEKGYDKVLSFNEPDYDQEANMSVDLASSYNQDFHSSGLRVGSPAVSESTVKENGWFENYWNRLEIKDDFIAVHNYPGYVGLDSEEYTPKKAAESLFEIYE